MIFSLVMGGCFLRRTRSYYKNPAHLDRGSEYNLSLSVSKEAVLQALDPSRNIIYREQNKQPHHLDYLTTRHSDYFTTHHWDYLTTQHSDYFTTHHWDYLTTQHSDYLTTHHLDYLTTQHLDYFIGAFTTWNYSTE